MRGNSLAKVITLLIEGGQTRVAARYRPGLHLSNAAETSSCPVFSAPETHRTQPIEALPSP
jgi:hypothetical protein